MKLLEWDTDTEGAIVEGLVTLYAPDAPEVDSGKWEVWVTSYTPATRWEPEDVDADVDSQHDTPWAALRRMAEILEQRDADNCAESEALAAEYAAAKNHEDSVLAILYDDDSA